MAAYKQSTLWKTAFPEGCTEYADQRKRIVEAYERFRERVEQLLGLIKAELPDLTLHDITHVDALWQVASEIAGPNYPLNPAEALVLGGAFLLHDAAHCRAAYPGGLAQLQATAEWQDSAAQRKLDPTTLSEGSQDFQAVLFDTLRTLHPQQARELPFAEWKDSDGTALRLFPDDELRDAYGDLIGQIAKSHWSHSHELEVFAKSTVTAPSCLSPANWTVDLLKLAILLRVADACHMDAKRAPRFLMLLKQPQGVSSQHWRFQSKLNQVKCDSGREELILSGSPFPASEQAAWWLAHDAACLADRELSAADSLLRDHHGQRLAAREITGIKSPQSFARQVPTKDWYPVDTSLRISNIQSVVERFGGAQLYGDQPWMALRELIQNARDAIHAARSLGYLGKDEGELEVAIEDTDDGHWLHVTDNGIGMSRYVLTEVLLDFGHSLWHSADLSGEWSGLAASRFEAVGQFGIGFFSIFMLGDKVRVCTRRQETKENESARGWILEFSNGLRERPLLREPRAQERLRHGTRVSVWINAERFEQLLPVRAVGMKYLASRPFSLSELCAWLAPALDIDLFLQLNKNHRQHVVIANDWKILSSFDLIQRLNPVEYDKKQPSNDGPWRHLTPLYDPEGKLIGRTTTATIGFMPTARGVVKGIYAGNVEGIEGIIFSKPQTDLARKDATPDISRYDLQQWAIAHARELNQAGKLTHGNSCELAQFGLPYTNLLLGKLDDKPIFYSELVARLNNFSTLIIVRSADFDFDYEEDAPVQEHEFVSIQIRPNVMEFEGDAYHLSWLNWIASAGLNNSRWSIDAALRSALKDAWGEFVWHEEYRAVIGDIDGTDISRVCQAATRLSAKD